MHFDTPAFESLGNQVTGSHFLKLELRMRVNIATNIPNFSMGADNVINEFHRQKVLRVIKDLRPSACAAEDSTMIEICRFIIRLRRLWHIQK
jgi:hypothetical protein